MLVFDYMIRLYNQDVSIGAAAPPAESAIDWRGLAEAESATKWRGSTADSAAAGSTHSWRGRIDWITVRNYLSLKTTKGKQPLKESG
jgi:hypothetical protein